MLYKTQEWSMSHILFLSSDPVLKEKNLEILHQNGIEADGVSECLEGLIILDKNDFDIVIIDDELTDVSGYEACVKVRQQTEAHILLLGTVSESEVWSKVEALGFDLYLKKPVSPRELLARVKALLRRPLAERKVAAESKQSPLQPPGAAAAGPKAEAPVNSTPQQPPAQSSSPVQPIPQFITPLPQVPPQQVFSQPQIPPSNNPLLQPAPVQAEPVPQQQAQPQPPPQQAVQQPVAASGAAQAFTPQYREPAPFAVPPVQQAQAQPSAPAKTPPAAAPAPQGPAAAYSEPAPFLVPPAEQNNGEQKPAEMRVKMPPPDTQKIQPVFFPEDSNANVLDDARIIKLVEAMVSGKLTDITPVIDFNYKLGFAYPAVDSLLDTTDQDTLDVLDNLAANGILIKEPYEKFYIDPENMFQLVPTERCPHCDSGEIVRGQLVEHFSCGYVGLDRDFKQDSRYVCPKCRKDLRLIGTDYRNVGMHYRCQDCNEVFTSPVVKWRNLKTRKVWNNEELKEVEVFSYRFSPDKRGWLEFQLKPKTQLVDFLRSRGYQVQELAQMTGRSGAVHTIDVLAIRDDILTKINLGIGLLVASTGESEVGLEALFKYDTRTYDIGINYKVVIAIPRLGPEAMNFANRQMIRAFEAKTLASVVTNITSLPGLPVNLQVGTEQAAMLDAQGSARAQIVKFLRNRGYDVYERALLAGKSGVEHIFDIFARRDDRIIIPTVAIGIAVSGSNRPVELDEVSRFDAAAFDCGIRNKVFIGIPNISLQAKQFARQQRIDIFEQQDLGRIN
jgi:DNA-binding NarL/FixJ family response regulator